MQAVSAQFFRFQSTPPSWEATLWLWLLFQIQNHFNPRLPRGRRPGLAPRPSAYYLFQSTPPSWEATRMPDSQ